MKIELLSVAQKRKPADIFVAGFFEKEKLAKEIESLEPQFAVAAKAALAKGRFEGKYAQNFSSFSSDYREAQEAVLFGLGQKKNHRKGCLRKATGQIIQLARARKAARVRIFLDSFVGGEPTLADGAAIISEISLLASYEFDKYKSKSEDQKKEKKLEIVEILFSKKQNESALRAATKKAQAIAQGVLLARTLINEPGNIMNAPELAARAKKMAAEKKIQCRILNEAEMKRLKMGGILSVNQGSVTPPALIVLEYGTRFKSKGTVCLVGKGVTFDTGGISIKPAKDMEKMKYDMSGAATVIATLGVISDLKLPVHVVGLTPAVENNVAENPQRPGDIIEMANGKTVEVLNTDAEGRLILGDALVYCGRYNPKAIIDLATLTGMCAYTFGDKAIGMMGTDKKLLSHVQKAGEETGERCWELPLWDDYRDQIKGHHSDLYNIGGPYGGTITAAMFLKEFVPAKTPWVHLDIAGTAWCDCPRYDCVKGATGVGVRLLIECLSHWK
ncbi:MAG: leucyl aminopeptidase [Candidatus Omnitrophica bacterium]|nr:leucyl aminopeptidase [Candidatus Omnitrophota bacterium]